MSLKISCSRARGRGPNPLAILLAVLALSFASAPAISKTKAEKAGAGTGTLVAVQPEDLPLLWTKVRGSFPSPWETFPSAGSTKCVAAPRPRPASSGNREEVCGICVAVGFIVEPDGRMSNVRALREVPASPLTRQVVNDVRRWRFKPTERNAARDAAYSYVVYTQIISGPMAPDDTGLVDSLAGLCRIENLAPTQ